MSGTEPDLAPITHELTVRCGPERAFHLYAVEMDLWWDPRFTPDAETFEGVLVQPRVGGRVAMRHAGERPHVWGEVLDWQPGRRFAQSFWLTHTAAAPTRVTVTFTGQPDGTTLVRLEHSGWSAQSVASGGKFRHWPVLLGGYARLAGISED